MARRKDGRLCPAHRTGGTLLPADAAGVLGFVLPRVTGVPLSWGVAWGAAFGCIMYGVYSLTNSSSAGWSPQNGGGGHLGDRSCAAPWRRRSPGSTARSRKPMRSGKAARKATASADSSPGARLLPVALAEPATLPRNHIIRTLMFGQGLQVAVFEGDAGSGSSEEVWKKRRRLIWPRRAPW